MSYLGAPVWPASKAPCIFSKAKEHFGSRLQVLRSLSDGCSRQLSTGPVMYAQVAFHLPKVQVTMMKGRHVLYRSPPVGSFLFLWPAGSPPVPAPPQTGSTLLRRVASL